MNFGGPGFVLAIIAMSMIAWIITTAIRAKHGYPLTDDCGRAVHPIKGDEKVTAALKEENSQLRATVNRLEARLRVLERIATDPAKRLSEDIDSLR
ncbi:hypothetical protein H9L13_07205 [Sphingomonas lutea]|uniref:Uncharacterized protein n=1 Tax=Sphingomonas lutea TaxID=1045317 RepID=A0A7G9SL48_9SPHN|nr:hypothetical protein [Sphingomonas lutea]QNN68573.1 hypothetical protein H9L13_07205 [Sphingomonas lutea]